MDFCCLAERSNGQSMYFYTDYVSTRDGQLAMRQVFTCACKRIKAQHKHCSHMWRIRMVIPSIKCASSSPFHDFLSIQAHRDSQRDKQRAQMGHSPIPHILSAPPSRDIPQTFKSNNPLPPLLLPTTGAIIINININMDVMK